MSIRKYSKGEVLPSEQPAVDDPKRTDKEARAQRIAALDAENRAADPADR